MSWQTGWWGTVADIDKQPTQSSFSRPLDTSWCQCAFSRPCACGNRVGPRRELLERAVSRFHDPAFQQRQKKRHQLSTRWFRWYIYILYNISILCQRKTQTGWKRVDTWSFTFSWPLACTIFDEVLSWKVRQVRYCRYFNCSRTVWCYLGSDGHVKLEILFSYIDFTVSSCANWTGGRSNFDQPGKDAQILNTILASLHCSNFLPRSKIVASCPIAPRSGEEEAWDGFLTWG